MAVSAATIVDVVGLLVILGINTAVAALTMRFFRVRLDTDWGPIVFALFFVPVALTALTIALSGFLGLGANVGDPGAVVAVTIVLPMAVGIAFDYFWMPAPDDVELPEKYRGGSSRR